MSGLTPKTRAMLLLKIACEAGARSEALDILGNGVRAIDDKVAVDWQRVHRDLEALLKTIDRKDEYPECHPKPY